MKSKADGDDDEEDGDDDDEENCIWSILGALYTCDATSICLSIPPISPYQTIQVSAMAKPASVLPKIYCFSPLGMDM